MKIAYLATWDVHKESGVLKKIRDQLSAWQRLGHTVALFAFTRPGPLWSGLEGLDVRVIRRRAKWQAPARYGALMARVLRWRPDVVYARFGPYKPALEALWSRVPVVQEVNTDDVQEFRRAQGRLEFALHMATRKRIFERSAGVISVTHEISQRLSGFSCPREVIANGIDLSRHQPLPAPTPSDHPRLVFVGTAGCRWHGVDQLAQLAARRPEWTFDVVGYGPDDLPEAPANMTLHGYLPKERYEPLLASADAAVGSLAIHRNGMAEACPLKVREYLAYGLPVILGYRDTDLDPNQDFVCQIPGQEWATAQHADAIEAFVQRWKGQRVPRPQIAHLDTLHKETRRIERLEAWRRTPARG